MRRGWLLVTGAGGVLAACTSISGADGFTERPADDAPAADAGALGHVSVEPSRTAGADAGAAEAGGAPGTSRPDGGAPRSPAPVADWPFDDGTGGEVKDVSGREHHGVAIGGRWTADRGGGAGRAFLLAGGTDHVQVPPHTDFDRPADARITILAWARFDAAPSHTYVVDVGYGSEGYGIELRTRTALTYWDGINHSVETTVPDVVGAWHHYGVVIEGARARVYFDGVRVQEGTADATPRVATEVVFGLDAVEPVYMRGAIDGVRFFRAALTDAEIAAEKER